MCENKNCRWLKTISFTLDKVDDIEEKVNEEIEKINKSGGKIVTILPPHNAGVSPIKIIYDIVYESEKPITEKEVI